MSSSAHRARSHRARSRSSGRSPGCRATTSRTTVAFATACSTSSFHGLAPREAAVGSPSSLALDEVLVRTGRRSTAQRDLSDRSDAADQRDAAIAARRSNSISARLNVTKGSFYHHNDAKDDLVVECFQRSFETMRRSAARGDGPIERSLVASSPPLRPRWSTISSQERGPLLRTLSSVSVAGDDPSRHG